MKFSGKVGKGTLNKLLNVGGNLDHGSGSIRIAIPIRRALAEVCTVPVLLVTNLPPSPTVKEF